MLQYAKNTSPETAFRNNSKSAIEYIKEEIKNHICFLRDVSETFKCSNMTKEYKETLEEAVFLAKWKLEFEKQERK